MQLLTLSQEIGTLKQGRIQGGCKGGHCPPPPWPKKERGERERKKERKIVSLNNFDILNIDRRASEGIGI